jgi:hypothetical protein
MASPKRAPAWGGGGSGGLDVPPALHIPSLGSAKRVCKRRDDTIVGPLFFTLLGAAFLAPMVIIGVLYGIEKALSLIALAFVGLILLPYGIVNLRRDTRGAKAIVEYDKGFAALVGSRASVWSWETIAAIVSDERYVSTKRGGYGQHDYEIRGHAGQQLFISDYASDDMRGLMSSVKKHAGRLLLPPLQTAYDDGKTLQFGAVTVNREAIVAKGRSFPWSTVANVKVKDGCLIVTPKNGEEFKVRASKIPNIEQLAVLIGLEPDTMDLVYI